MPYTRSTYTLVHHGETLLSLDAALTPPFSVGEDVELFNEETQESMGVFLVEKVSRAIPYRVIVGAGSVAIEAAQEFTVHLRRRLPVEEAIHDANPR